MHEPVPVLFDKITFIFLKTKTGTAALIQRLSIRMRTASGEL
jgi:hypothetical protein